MPSATARANASIDSVALRMWASLASCTNSKGMPHEYDPRALYAEALLSGAQCPLDRVARKQVIFPAFFALTEPDLRLPYSVPENSLQTTVDYSSLTTTQLYTLLSL